MNNAYQADAAVVIGRFQPFHNGHLNLLRIALQSAPRVIVVLGSSFHARSAKNPFNAQERAAMINTVLSDQENERISFIAVRDYYEDARWSAALRTKVELAAGDAKRIALVGYFKDASSYYLNQFSQWELITAEAAQGIDATTIRRILFESENPDVSLHVLDEQVPNTVRQYLSA